MPHKLRTLVPPFALVLLLALGLASARPGVPQGDVAVQVQHVAGSVSCLIAPGAGNIGVSAGDDGVLMIDSQMLERASAITAALKELSPHAPTFLLNTHWHFDHTGGNPHFGAGATIVAQANVRRRLAGDASIGGRVAQPVEPKGLPEVTFDETVKLHFNEEVRVRHYPNAHTDGDGVVWFATSKVVHMGDLYFQIGYPYIDLDSGGSVQGLIEAVKAVLDELPEDAKVIPGHGAVTGVEGLREYVGMLETLADRVRTGLAAGKSAEDLVTEGVSADFDARWGHFDFVKPADFVRTLARSLAEK